MYAIVETGGKQYKLEEGKYTDIELIEGETIKSGSFYRPIH